MVSKYLSVLVSSLVLAACGGGGGETPTTATFSALEPITEFLGVWKSACFSQNVIFDGSASASALTSSAPSSKPSLYITRQLTVTRRDASSVKVAELYTVYGPTDSTCSGTARGTISNAASGDGYSIDAATGITSGGGYPVVTLDRSDVVTNGSTSVTAKLASVQRVSLLSGSEGMYAYSGTDGAGHRGFGVYEGDFAASNFKDAYYVNGTTLITGLSPGVSYPTALGTTTEYKYTKQAW